MKKLSGIVAPLIILGLVLFFLLSDYPLQSMQSLANLLSLLLALLATLWIHEIGHLLGGIAVGLGIDAAYFWPYRADRAHKWKVRTMRFGEWSDDGGFYLKSIQGARSKMIISIFCGWLASIVFSAVTYIAWTHFADIDAGYWRISDPSMTLATYVWIRFLSFSWMFSLAYLVLSALPLRQYSMYWDGALALDLLKGGKTADRAIARYVLECEALRTRPRDWDPALLTAIEDERDSDERLVWIWRNYQNRLDANDINGARQWLEVAGDLLDKRGDLNTMLLRCEQVYLLAVLGSDDFDLEAKYEELYYPKEWWFPYYRATVLMKLREGKAKEAMYYASYARQRFDADETRGAYAMEADLFDRLLECAATELVKPVDEGEATRSTSSSERTP